MPAHGFVLTGTSSTDTTEANTGIGLVRTLILVASFTCILLVLGFLFISQQDPYVSAVLRLNGSEDNGADLFRMNCAACHGINAQGLVGPSLKDISSSRRDTALIKQVISGRTPPMPRFELDPEPMSAILAFLQTLS